LAGVTGGLYGSRVGGVYGTGLNGSGIFGNTGVVGRPW